MPNDKLDRRALPELKLMPAPISGWVAPRDRWELQVAQVWQKLLQTGPVSINDDFFTLGGDSLLAVRLVARMEQEFGRQIPVATLLSAPTVADVAALLRHQPKAQEWSPLVPIQPRGGQPPLFCMHPIGGHVLCYFKLAQELGADQPVYGLQARGLEDDQPPPLSVEAMAADYISSIRTVQPHGPYYLCGWSFGGVIAFEMAQQLLRDGEQIGLLSVFDSSLIPPIAPVHTPAEELKVLAWALGGVFNKEIPLSLDELEGLSPDEMLAFLLERIQSLEVVPTDIGLPQMRRYLAVFRSVIHASHTYVPQDYPRSVLLFQAAEAPLEEQEHRAAEWSRVAGGRVIVDNVPGSHFSLMNTPEVLARRLRHELDLAFADATAPIPTPQAV
jgi:thioesterase domain-containing protein/acyl carrier protein